MFAQRTTSHLSSCDVLAVMSRILVPPSLRELVTVPGILPTCLVSQTSCQLIPVHFRCQDPVLALAPMSSKCDCIVAIITC